jgi:hypothetical protein
MPSYFRVTKEPINIRIEPGVAVNKVGGQLHNGDVIEVANTTTAVQQDGYNWLRHQLGWSAKCTSNNKIFL